MTAYEDHRAPLVSHNVTVDGLECHIEYQPYGLAAVPKNERTLSYVALFVEGLCVQTIQGAMSFDEVIDGTNWGTYIQKVREAGWFSRSKIDEDEALEMARHGSALRLIARRRELAT